MRPASEAIEALLGQILSPSVAHGVGYWNGLRGARRFPARREIDPTAIPRELLRITLVDVSREPLDFRIRLVGQHVRDRMGAAAGQRVADVIRPDQGLENLLSRYSRCVLDERPVRALFRYTSLIPPHDRIWVEAVSCPLSGEEPDRVDHIVTFAADSDFPEPKPEDEIP